MLVRSKMVEAVNRFKEREHWVEDLALILLLTMVLLASVIGTFLAISKPAAMALGIVPDDEQVPESTMVSTEALSATFESTTATTVVTTDATTSEAIQTTAESTATEAASTTETSEESTVSEVTTEGVLFVCA